MAILSLIANNKVLESRIFNDRHLALEGYLEGLQRDMLENQEEVMDLTVPTTVSFRLQHLSHR